MFLLSMGGGSHSRDAESSIEPGGRDPFSAACPVPFSPQAPPSGCRVCEPRPSSSEGPLGSTVNWCGYIVALVLLGLLCGKQGLDLRLGEEQVAPARTTWGCVSCLMHLSSFCSDNTSSVIPVRHLVLSLPNQR